MQVENFVSSTLKLLVKERDAELEENRILQENVSTKELQRRGLCLAKLRIAEQKTGLYGRTVLKFQPLWEEKELPSHKLTSGDIAGLSLTQEDNHQEQLASGIVTRVGISSISIAFDESYDRLDIDDSASYKLVKLANDVTYKRLKQALNNLNGYRSGRAGLLINVLFRVSEPSPPISVERDGVAASPDLDFYNSGLDDSQKQAVRFALCQRELAIIHGPPGTGKTTTVVEIIMQAIKQKLKILACAPSNIAVDNLVERVSNYGKKVVRLGHPARLLPGIQKYSLDAILAHSEETRLVEDVRRDMDKTLSKMKKTRNYGEKQQLREDMKYLRKELRQREQDATKGILNRAEVIMATLTGASGEGPLKMLDEEHFDLIIIDECSQALEAACWIALLRGTKCVLAGDHNQLPPTIISHQAAKEGLELTLMERQLKLHGENIMRMLTVQYRMNEVIMKWSSDELYQGRLTAHSSVAHHLLRDNPTVDDNEDTSIPMLLIDTASCHLSELYLPDEMSKGNEGEADLVCYHVQKLIKSGLSAEDIAVIAPYNLQVDFLRIRLAQKHPGLEIKSVDGFQGREKEAVIISMVRSNNSGEVGFLAEDRRINVAITRARRHLTIVCDTDTIGHHPFLKTLTEYIVEHGEVRSAQQYIDEGAINTDYERPEYIDKQFQASEEFKQMKKITQKINKPQSMRPAKKKESYDKSHKPILTSEKTKLSFANERSTESEDDQESVFREILTKFLQDKKTQQHVFPSTLTSSDRYLVHEIAESFGLLHISEGDGKDRHILVKKRSEKSIQSDSIKSGEKKVIESSLDNITDNINSSNRIEIQSKFKQREENPDLKILSDNHEILVKGAICDNCKKEIPQNNIELHMLRCSKIPQVSSETCEDSVKPKKKKKPAKSKTSEAKNFEKHDDFDSLIQAALEENNVCNYSRCKSYTSTVGQICPFCNRRFCLLHHIPEVHGCGTQAKAHARAVINKDGVLYRGSGVPDKKMDPAKKAHLQRKLDKKLSEMTDKRKAKKKKVPTATLR